MYKVCIIGTGRQGTAAAYDLLKFSQLSELLLIDSNASSIDNCIKKINKISSGLKVTTLVIDIDNKVELIKNLLDYDIFLSSVPYKYNLMLTEVAIQSSTSMVDLGGHTGNVIKQLNYNNEAKGKGITIVPDCGMGPGMNVTMALYAMEQLDEAFEVKIWDGGLPKNPQNPWNYSLFFNIAGLTNEYDGNAFFIRDGKVIEVPCFEDFEIIDFGPDIGQLEAVVTSGGLSTMPWTYKDRLEILENKTLRYKNHWEWMTGFRELGLFSEDKVMLDDHWISPRDFYHALLEPQLNTGDRNDLCVMRIKAKGLLNGQSTSVIVNCIEYYDEDIDLMAMEKWTGWHASIVMQHILVKNISSGTYPIERAITGEQFVKEALKRNYNISTEIIKE